MTQRFRRYMPLAILPLPALRLTLAFLSETCADRTQSMFIAVSA